MTDVVTARPKRFERSRLRLRRIEDRGHDLLAGQCRSLEPPRVPFAHPNLDEFVTTIRRAREHGRPVILMLGGHPIKLGLSRFIIHLIERGIITLVAMNGAALIHDFELALVGGTSEDVAKWIKCGQFGLWNETSRLNDVIREAADCDEGLGPGVGRRIVEDGMPHAELSIAAAGWRCGIPVTCHVSIGQDIIHSHPNCDGAAVGQTSYADFLVFAEEVRHLEHGVFINLGSAVTGPEVFLKALSMARNVATQHDEEIRHFTTAVFDLVRLPTDFRDGPPGMESPLYYHRPWKTVLCRAVADGGRSFHFCGHHSQTIPTLWDALVNG